jgi:hypothetical protein
VFVAGVGAGVLVDRVMLRGPTVRARLVAPGMTSVLDKLGLTAEQRAKADSILSRRAPASETVMMEMAEHLRAVADSVDRELRQILTPAQVARLDSMRLAEPQLMLKRKTVTPRGTKVDTILIRDSVKPPA